MDTMSQGAETFDTLLDPREAMTVAVRVQLSPSLVDTRIVAATRHAATLYGYEDPAELHGQYTSMVHLLEDIQRTRLRSTLRALGLVHATECYEVRLRRRSGELVRVVKEVEQRQVGETIVWICRLERATTRRAFQPPPVPSEVPEDALHTLFGWLCVAEVEAHIGWRAGRHCRRPADSLGTRLARARRARGLTLAQVAAQILNAASEPVSLQFIAALERDQRRPPAHMLSQLAAAYALPLAALAEPGLVDAYVHAYLHEYPEQYVALINLFRVALAQGFAAWERLTRQLAALPPRPAPRPRRAPRSA